jgi:histidinol-phosphate phosphatase family protein
VPYNIDPTNLRLRDDAGAALQALQYAGYELILVINQSGVALGYFEESALDAVWRALREQLGNYSVQLSAVYYCPHHPAGRVAPYALACDCRKPKAGLLRRAARERGIDLARSWMIGDILDDIEAGRRAGCRTALLDVGSETEWHRSALRTPHYIAPSLALVSNHIVGIAS